MNHHEITIHHYWAGVWIYDLVGGWSRPLWKIAKMTIYSEISHEVWWFLVVMGQQCLFGKNRRGRWPERGNQWANNMLQKRVTTKPLYSSTNGKRTSKACWTTGEFFSEQGWGRRPKMWCGKLHHPKLICNAYQKHMNLPQKAWLSTHTFSMECFMGDIEPFNPTCFLILISWWWLSRSLADDSPYWSTIIYSEEFLGRSKVALENPVCKSSILRLFRKNQV